MAGETVVTVIGNLTEDPNLRHTNTGVPVASFTVASTPRVFDRESNSWKDGDALFLRCSVWRDVAENVADSLTKGSRVIVQGRLKQRSYNDAQGNPRTVFELDVEEVGVSLRYHTAKPVRAQRGSGGGNFGGGQNFGGNNQGWAQPQNQNTGFGQQEGYGQAPQSGGYAAPAQDANPWANNGADEAPPF